MGSRGEAVDSLCGLSAWRDNTQCEASSLDKKFVRKVAAADRRARPRPLCNSAPLETETYAKPPFLPQMMQPWTHCLNQKENERPSSLSFLPCLLPASLCTIIAELLTSSFDGSMRRDIRANNQLLNLTNFAVLDEGLRSGGRSPSVQRPVKPSFQNLFKGTDACAVR